PPHTYTLSLHDALPISRAAPDESLSEALRKPSRRPLRNLSEAPSWKTLFETAFENPFRATLLRRPPLRQPARSLLSETLFEDPRSEEHTSELQSRGHLV